MLTRSLSSLRLHIIAGLAVMLTFTSPSAAQRRAAAPPLAQRAARSAAPVKKPTAAKQATAPNAASPVKPASPRSPLDLQYITGDFALAVVVHPQPILAMPLIQALPVELAQAVAQEQLGIDLSKLREIIVLLSIDAKGEPQPAVIARFNAPVDQATIERKVRQLFQREGPEAPMAIVPEPHTVLVGRRALLEKMFRAKGDAQSPLLQRLRQLDSGAAAAAVAVVSPLRDELRQAISLLPPLPPAFDEVAELPALVDFSQISISVGEKTESAFVVECRDEKSAARLESLMESAIKFAQEALDAQLAQMQGRAAPATEQAPLLYARRMFRQTVDSIERQRAGNRLTLHGRGEIGAAPAMAAVVAGLMLPAVQSARQAAMRSQSVNHLKMIGIAFHNFHDVFGRFPTSSYDKDGKPLLSWRVHILPFIEQQGLYQQFHFDEPWNSDHNKKLIAQMPDVYHHPAFSDAERTIYLAPTGPAAVFPPGKDDGGDAKAVAAPGAGIPGAGGAALGGAIGQAVAFRKDNVDLAWARNVSFRNITDGTSNTIMVVEADPQEAMVWTQPDDLPIDPEKPMVGLGGLQKGGFNALYCDGSVHFLKTTIAAETLRRLFNPRDGLPIPRDGE